MGIRERLVIYRFIFLSLSLALPICVHKGRRKEEEKKPKEEESSIGDDGRKKMLPGRKKEQEQTQAYYTHTAEGS